MIYVDEVFLALQGEGVNSGFPSIFIRLGGCNLKCEGFGCKAVLPLTGKTVLGCDSIHSVNQEFKSQWTPVSSFEKMVDLVSSVMPKINKNAERPDIVFTGGEPLLNSADTVLYNSVKYYLSRGYRVWFETNGTVGIDFEAFPKYKYCNFVISPKLSASGEELKTVKKVHHMDRLIANSKESVFKFVVNGDLEIEDQMEEISNLLRLIPSFAPVYLMPVGENRDALYDTAIRVYEAAMEYGFRYSDRLHIRMYDDKRGV